MQPRSLDELQNRILQEATLIYREMIRNAVTHFYNRIAFCQEAQGFQFEHLHWSVRGKGTHSNQASRNVRDKGTRANQAPRNVRGKGTHANQAPQREQNLLHPRRCTWVMLNVNANCLAKPWRNLEDHHQDQYGAHHWISRWNLLQELHWPLGKLCLFQITSNWPWTLQFKIVVIKLIEPKIDEIPLKCNEKITKSTETPSWPIFNDNGG